jgi:hypothetical protein
MDAILIVDAPLVAIRDHIIAERLWNNPRLGNPG